VVFRLLVFLAFVIIVINGEFSFALRDSGRTRSLDVGDWSSSDHCELY